MMRQRVTAQAGGNEALDKSNARSALHQANTNTTAAGGTVPRPAARRRRQLSSSGVSSNAAGDSVSSSHWNNSATSHEIKEDEEDSFVGLTARRSSGTHTFESNRRSWSSEDLTTIESVAYQGLQPENPSRIEGVALPPGSGGLLVESKTNAGTLPLSRSNPQLPSLRLQQSSPPSLEHYHVLYRTALHVPDSRYAEFIKGQSTRRKQPLFTSHCCAHVCVGFSVVAVVFLLWVGLMFDTQPLYIKGSLPEHIMTDQDTGKPILIYKIPAAASSSWLGMMVGSSEEQLQAAASAYRAAFAYFLCILGSYHVLYPNFIKSRFYRFRRGYENLDELNTNQHVHSSTSGENIINKMNNNGGEPSLPMYQQKDGESSSSAAYSTTTASALWNRAVVNGRQWLAARGWYKPGGGQRRLPNTKTV